MNFLYFYTDNNDNASTNNSQLTDFSTLNFSREVALGYKSQSLNNDLRTPSTVIRVSMWVGGEESLQHSSVTVFRSGHSALNAVELFRGYSKMHS